MEKCKEHGAGQNPVADRQTSLLKSQGILRSGKGAFHASAGLGAAVVRFEYCISSSSQRIQLPRELISSLVSWAFSRLVKILFSMQIEGVAQLTHVLLRPSWSRFLHCVQISFAGEWSANRRFRVGSCRGSLVSKVWLADTVRGRLLCLSCLGSSGSTGRVAGDGTGMADTVLWVGRGVCSALSSDIDPRLGLLVIGRSGWLARAADSDDGYGRWTRTTDPAD